MLNPNACSSGKSDEWIAGFGRHEDVGDGGGDLKPTCFGMHEDLQDEGFVPAPRFGMHDDRFPEEETFDFRHSSVGMHEDIDEDQVGSLDPTMDFGILRDECGCAGCEEGGCGEGCIGGCGANKSMSRGMAGYAPASADSEVLLPPMDRKRKHRKRKKGLTPADPVDIKDMLGDLLSSQSCECVEPFEMEGWEGSCMQPDPPWANPEATDPEIRCAADAGGLCLCTISCVSDYPHADWEIDVYSDPEDHGCGDTSESRALPYLSEPADPLLFQTGPGPEPSPHPEIPLCPDGTPMQMYETSPYVCVVQRGCLPFVFLPPFGPAGTLKGCGVCFGKDGFPRFPCAYEYV